jgi:hypothetical protein
MNSIFVGVLGSVVGEHRAGRVTTLPVRRLTPRSQHLANMHGT